MSSTGIRENRGRSSCRRVGIVVLWFTITIVFRANKVGGRAIKSETEVASQRRGNPFHEIRNPLSAISGAIEALPKIVSLDPEASRLVEIAKPQKGHLNRIVDDLLDVGRMLSGKFAGDTKRTDLGDCVLECVEAMR